VDRKLRPLSRCGPVDGHNNMRRISGPGGGNVLDRTIGRVSADIQMNEVSLCGRQIGDDGLIRLSEALFWNSYVKYLNISNNNIGHEGAEALADALQQNLYIEHIDLSDNNIGNKGAVALADCLQHNNMSVISLNLQNNSIEAEGAAALLSAIKFNTAIHSVNLKGNNIPTSILTKIDEALNRTKPMVFVSFSSPLLERRIEEEQHHEQREDEDTPSLPFRGYASYVGLESFTVGSISLSENRMVSRQRQHPPSCSSSESSGLDARQLQKKCTEENSITSASTLSLSDCSSQSYKAIIMALAFSKKSNHVDLE
jgi:hypothetical protein